MLESCKCVRPDGDNDVETCLNTLKRERNDAKLCTAPLCLFL